MRVALVATVDFAVVRLVARVDVRVFLSVGAIGELPLATFEFALKRLFSCSLRNNIQFRAVQVTSVPRRVCVCLFVCLFA